MQTSNRLFDDLAKVANGAVSTLSSMKAEIEAMVRQQIERILVDTDLVARDEFDAVSAVAAEGRLQQEKLEIRVAALEVQLAAKSGAKAKTTPKKAAKPKKPAK